MRPEEKDTFGRCSGVRSSARVLLRSPGFPLQAWRKKRCRLLPEEKAGERGFCSHCVMMRISDMGKPIAATMPPEFHRESTCEIWVRPWSNGDLTSRSGRAAVAFSTVHPSGTHSYLNRLTQLTHGQAKPAM